MGLMDNVKFARKSMAIVNVLKSKTDDELNNLLYDLRLKYKFDDDDWMTIEAAVALLTQKKIMSQLGIKGGV